VRSDKSRVRTRAKRRTQLPVDNKESLSKKADVHSPLTVIKGVEQACYAPGSTYES
jgi:hypothetical protein